MTDELLTDRQAQAVALIAELKTPAAVAAAMGLGRSHVLTLLYAAERKLGRNLWERRKPHFESHYPAGPSCVRCGTRGQHECLGGSGTRGLGGWTW